MEAIGGAVKDSVIVFAIMGWPPQVTAGVKGAQLLLAASASAVDTAGRPARLGFEECWNPIPGDCLR